MSVETIAANPQTRRIVLLQKLGGVPDRISAIIAAVPDAAHTWRPAAEAWSISHTVAHLSAAHEPFQQRLMRIASEDNPAVPYFGPDTARPDFTKPLPELMVGFRKQRAAFLAFLAEVAPAVWRKPAVHAVYGPTTFAQQVQLISDHDAEHVDQIGAVVARWQAAHA